MMLYVYSIPPIDFWGGWTRASEAIGEEQGGKIEKAEFDEMWRHAQDLGGEAGWEGDIRGDELWVAGMPQTEGGITCFMIAWKQENNGTTFVASPYPLPHLDEDAWKTATREV